MRVAALLPLVLLVAACDDPTQPKLESVRIYDLESMFDRPTPIANGPYELQDQPGVVCVDTLQWQSLHLVHPSTLRVLTSHVQRCDNSRVANNLGGTWTGTWTTLPGDSIRLTWNAGGIVGNVTTIAHTSGDSLTIGVPVYSEGDPESQMRYIVYRRP